jgi:hypothetical protein
MKTPQTLLEFMKTPSSFEGMLGGCQYYNTPNFIKNKLLPNPDNLTKLSQTLHNYIYLSHLSSNLTTSPSIEPPLR